MRLGTDLGTLAELIIRILVCHSLRLARQESRRLLGGFAVVKPNLLIRGYDPVA
jgi:hypothetical protein